jgi:hypothetical protein
MAGEAASGSEQSWSVTVGGLFRLFRGGLVALVSTFDEARIRWRDDENYDDFERIAEALYDSLVRDAISNAEGLAGIRSVQRYGFTGPEASSSRIYFGNPSLGQVFVALATREQPFDHVIVKTPTTSTSGDDLKVVPYVDNAVTLEARGAGGTSRLVSDLVVRL